MRQSLRKSAAKPKLPVCPEPVSRLAGIRHALRLVDDFGGGPAPDPCDDSAIVARWAEAGEARRRLFERRSASLVDKTSAGFAALLGERRDGREPNAEAAQAMLDDIRRELREVAGIIVG